MFPSLPSNLMNKTKNRWILNKEVFHKAAESKMEEVMDGRGRAAWTKMSDLMTKKTKRITNSQVVLRTQKIVAEKSLNIRTALGNR